MRASGRVLPGIGAIPQPASPGSRHGDVLRWRGLMDAYLINEPDHVRQVLTQAWPRFTRGRFDYRVLKVMMGNGLGTNDRRSWTRQRRMMQPMFHSRVVNAFDTAINAATEALSARWLARGDAPFALDRDPVRLTFHIVGHTLFGTGMSMLEIQPVPARLLSQFRVRPVPGHPVVRRASASRRPPRRATDVSLSPATPAGCPVRSRLSTLRAHAEFS